MVDFDKLNAMIDEVNNIISDVETETIRMNHNTENIKKNKFVEVNKILANYYDIYIKSIGGQYCKSNLTIDVPLGAGRIGFKTGGIYVHAKCHEDSKDPNYNSYYICCNNNDAIIEDSYTDYNKSHPSIIWFTNLTMVWNDYENEFDKLFTEQLHYILKCRSENAHEKYNKAQKNFEHFNNLI